MLTNGDFEMLIRLERLGEALHCHYLRTSDVKTFGRLIARGFVTARWVDGLFVARMTPSGREALTSWRAAPAVAPPAGLTHRQREAFNFIARYLAEHGASPSYAEIGAAIGVRGRSATHGLVHELVARGVLTRIRGRARSLSIAPGAEAAGPPARRAAA